MKCRILFKKSAIITSVIAGVAVMFATKSEDKNDLSLKNVKMLQVSAGEAECKDTSKNRCEIHIANGPTLIGVGQPWGSW
jgi:hypothetical protein